MESPSMGLLRRPTPGEIVEDGRLGRPCGRARFRAHSRKPTCGYAAISIAQQSEFARYLSLCPRACSRAT
jgi:hypothetical protein